jgi:hypothetical protein
MKKIIFLGLLISLGLFSCKSNYTRVGDKNANYIPYYLKVYEADSLYLLKNYESSYKILDSLFKKYEPINMPMYFEYENYIKMAVKFNKVKKEDLKNLARNYDYRYNDFNKDSLLNVALNKFKFSTKQIDDLHNKFESEIDTVYRNLLYKMNFDDQKVRISGNTDSNEVRIVDFKNDSLLRLNLNRFPTVQKVGSWKKLNHEDLNGNVSLDVVLIHLSAYENLFEYYDNRFLDYVRKGECLPKTYAHMKDKNNMIYHNESFYHFLFPSIKSMDDNLKKEIDNRRKKTGLPSIEYEKIWFEERLMKM